MKTFLFISLCDDGRIFDFFQGLHKFTHPFLRKGEIHINIIIFIPFVWPSLLVIFVVVYLKLAWEFANVKWICCHCKLFYLAVFVIDSLVPHDFFFIQFVFLLYLYIIRSVHWSWRFSSVKKDYPHPSARWCPGSRAASCTACWCGGGVVF